ncbi:hypothetical protein FB565_005981 [Actinoplanes lutulentus]|uniref:DUF4190 domain-containing protein n=1 Tax=Actinoplanes lutulentus TaxID=1287878 RepID=A0A327Z9H3_9ACTN|nr:hypothetical protein [Actinoplanes lutulentus]MBB2946223.1 hypothetical protein [Actinoplanes lutulentus]RAK32911.1 hypothetical protein B0I29_113208 [Actinoplanes lutulentus]
MRIPTFPRQSSADTTVEDRPTASTTPTTQRDDRLPQRTSVAPRPSTVTPPRDETTTTIPAVRTESQRAASVTEERPTAGRATVEPKPVADRKPRASFMATLGLIAGVAGALLVLSGPLMGYGIGVAALGLLLSIGGLLGTRKRHVAGKTDALIGLLLSIGAIVIGVLALTGSLYWLGTDMQPVNDLRQWLDAQFAARF